MDFELRLVSPDFDSRLTDTLIELNHLRRLQLRGTTAPCLFFQLKNIFHMLESIGSARIEGNRTTISEYIEQKIDNTQRSSERFSEIANLETAMAFIEDNLGPGTDVTHAFVRQLHELVVGDLTREGDKTPGAYRSWDVKISGSVHVPPEHSKVQGYMDELIAFINQKQADKYDLLKTAIAHHRMAWIHPFGNGNGRTVRLLTYALMIKYGFNVRDGKILNPTAVFCNDRNVYYQKLAEADAGSDETLLGWCEYVLSGILEEVEKINQLLDFDFLHEKILNPTLRLATERGYINRDEARVLSVGIGQQQFKAGDLDNALGGFTTRQRTHLIHKMKQARFIRPIMDNGRTYCVSFENNYLMRCLMQTLEKAGFVPPLDR